MEARKRKQHQEWDQEHLDAAISLVEKGNTSLRRIAADYDIPESTLRRYIKQGKLKQAQLGREPFLGREIETELVDWIVGMTNRNLSPTFLSVRLKALRLGGVYPVQKDGAWDFDFDPTDENGNQIKYFGKNWRKAFIKRNPILTTAWAKTLDYDRLQSSETVRLKDFFEVLDELKGQISSVRQIYNMDETSFAPGTTEYKIKVFTTRGKQRANRISAAKGKHCTLVVFC